MTSKAESLVDALIDASRNTSSVVSELRELVCYIEELERKAADYDADANPPAYDTSEREPERNE